MNATQLDSEYKLLFDSIMSMMNQLSSISLEFVSSKLTFLEKYSQTLKSSQIDARQHRNNQMRNLMEYVKLHRKQQVRSVFHSPVNSQTFHQSSRFSKHSSIDLQDYQIHENITVAPQTCSDSKLTHTTTMKNLLKNIVTKKQKKDPIISLLEDAMKLLESNQQYYQDEYNELNQQYKTLQKENPQLRAKISLLNKSSKIKEDLNTLIETQKTFKSYLNSII